MLVLLQVTSVYLPGVQNTNAVCTICNYNGLGGCSKAQSALTTAPYKDKEKLVRIK